MRPLQLNVIVAGTPEGIRANIQSALARNLPEIVPALVSHDGTMLCVGSGPSMPDFITEIRDEHEKGRPIFAVKGAHDYLCRQGLPPDLWLCVDPRDRSDLLQEANDVTTYLVSSRCDPSMFEALKNRRVMVMHAWAEEEQCPEYKGKFMIGGGSTSGLRAVTTGYVMGYRNFILYGYDSCLSKDKTQKRFTGEGPGQIFDVIVGGKRFWTNGAMAKQAHEFQDYYAVLDGIHMTARGDGLIAAIIQTRQERGFAV